MKKQKVRFALVGCGRIAKKHAEVLAKQIPEAELVAVCDTEKDRAEEYGRIVQYSLLLWHASNDGISG